MNKFFTILIGLCFAVTMMAQRTASMSVGDGICHYDTLIHRHVGPGATYSKYQFSDISYEGRTYKMRMYLLSVDLSNPYLKVTPYLSKNEYYSLSPQTKEVARMKAEGLKPVATIMGGGFEQANVVTDTTTAYEMWSSLVGDGRVFFDDGLDLQKLSIDDNGIARVGGTRLNATLSFGSTSMKIGQVNHHREVGDALNAISLYCNGIPKSLSADPLQGVDVRVRVDSNDGNIIVGGENQCTVVEVLNGCGHKLNAGEAIISCSPAMAPQLQSLQPGDAVSINMTYDCPSANGMNLKTLITHHPTHGIAIKDGEVIPTKTLSTAGVMAGCSQDGKRLYLADLEISVNSNAPYNCLSEAMRQIGAYDAIWLDGGPSAEMTVDGDFVTTNSIGTGFNGRYIPSGVVLLSTAPEDNTLSSIEALDPTPKEIQVGDKLAPMLYGYNKYGEMILVDALKSPDVVMICDETLGKVENGVFIAMQPGSGFLHISLKGSSEVISIPVTVRKQRLLTVYPKKVFTGEGRECQIQVSLTDDGVTRWLYPWDAQWTTDASIIINSCDDGYIVPFLDGTADVYASYQELQDTVVVTVENLEDEYVSYLNFDTEVTGETHIYKHLPSVPTGFRIAVESAPQSTVTVFYTCGDSIFNVSKTVPASGRANIDVALDYDNILTYPVSVEYISGSNIDNLPGEGMPYVIRGLTAYYYYTPPSGVEEIDHDSSESAAEFSQRTFNLQGLPVSPSYRGIVIKNGKKYIR